MSIHGLLEPRASQEWQCWGWSGNQCIDCKNQIKQIIDIEEKITCEVQEDVKQDLSILLEYKHTKDKTIEMEHLKGIIKDDKRDAGSLAQNWKDCQVLGLSTFSPHANMGEWVSEWVARNAVFKKTLGKKNKFQRQFDLVKGFYFLEDFERTRELSWSWNRSRTASSRMLSSRRKRLILCLFKRFFFHV